MDYVPRESYIDRIAPFIGNRNAKVITGVRRSGKSTIIKELPSHMDDFNILLYDMEFWSNRKYRNPDVL